MVRRRRWICKVNEPLAGHPFPGSMAGDPFGSGAAPEEGVSFLGEGRVGESII